jgi:hypothetical protein
MNSSRKAPWISGLMAAAVVAVWLMVLVVHGAISVIGDAIAATPPGL